MNSDTILMIYDAVAITVLLAAVFLKSNAEHRSKCRIVETTEPPKPLKCVNRRPETQINPPHPPKSGYNTPPQSSMPELDLYAPDMHFNGESRNNTTLQNCRPFEDFGACTVVKKEIEKRNRWDGIASEVQLLNIEFENNVEAYITIIKTYQNKE